MNKNKKREKLKISEFTHDQRLKIAVCFERQSKKVSRLGTAISKAKEELYKDPKFPGFDGYHALNFTWRAKHEKNSKLSKEFYSQKLMTKDGSIPCLSEEKDEDFSNSKRVHIHIHHH